MSKLDCKHCPFSTDSWDEAREHCQEEHGGLRVGMMEASSGGGGSGE